MAMQEGHLLPDAVTAAHPQYAPFLSPEPLGGFITGFFGFIIPYAPATINTNEPEGEDQNNLSLGDFLYSWAVVGTERLTRKRKRGPNLSYVQELRSEKLKEIKRSNLRGQNCDIQGLDWKRLEVSRSDARLMRAQTYRSYVNLTPPPSHVSVLLNFLIYLLTIMPETRVAQGCHRRLPKLLQIPTHGLHAENKLCPLSAS